MNNLFSVGFQKVATGLAFYGEHLLSYPGGGRENSQQQKLKLSDPMANHWLGQPLYRTFCVRFKRPL